MPRLDHPWAAADGTAGGAHCARSGRGAARGPGPHRTTGVFAATQGTHDVVSQSSACPLEVVPYSTKSSRRRSWAALARPWCLNGTTQLSGPTASRRTRPMRVRVRTRVAPTTYCARAGSKVAPSTRRHDRGSQASRTPQHCRGVRGSGQPAGDCCGRLRRQGSQPGTRVRPGLGVEERLMQRGQGQGLRCCRGDVAIRTARSLRTRLPALVVQQDASTRCHPKAWRSSL